MFYTEKEKVYDFYMLNLETKEKKFFETLEDLLNFLARSQGISWYCTLFGEDSYNNRYLDECNLTGFDRYFKKIYNFQTKDYDYKSYLKRFMFFNKNDEVIDVTKHSKSIKKRAELIREQKRLESLPNYTFRKGPVPGTGKSRFKYCFCLKHPQTANEKRKASIPEYKKYIRGKRRFANIPDAYDDEPICNQRSWKTKTKARKQWAKHTGYVREKKKEENFDCWSLYEEED